MTTGRPSRGTARLGDFPRANVFWATAATAASVAVGALSVVAPLIAAGVFLMTAGSFVAWVRPGTAIAACIITASLHRGLFLYLRIEPGGYPVSVFDVVPFILLLASISLTLRQREPRRAARGVLSVAWVMIATGFVIGLAIGVSSGAAGYEVVRIVRLEGMVVAALAAALVAGHIPAWRTAVLRGMAAAAVVVAGQLLITFGWSLATGSYFWGLFPFGKSIPNLPGQIEGGNILTLRENAIPSFLILPALALTIVRFTRRDVFRLILLVAAGLVTLSRGLWVAMLLTLIIALAHRAASGRLSGGRLAVICLPVAAIVLVTSVASGGILGQRLGETTDLSGDKSFEGRLAETQAGLRALEQSAGTLVFGLGTGVGVTYQTTSRTHQGSSALLENSVLSTWTNTGLLGLIGVSLLFFGGATYAWRLARREDVADAAALGAMGLALPVLWLQGLVGGILTVPEPAVAVFVLAVGVLAAPMGIRLRSESNAAGPPRTGVPSSAAPNSSTQPDRRLLPGT